MRQYLKFYIGGEWVDPVTPNVLDVINPATEEPCAQISSGSSADVDRAVAAARAAFKSYSQWSVEQRADLLSKIIEVYKKRFNDIAVSSPWKWVHRSNSHVAGKPSSVWPI